MATIDLVADASYAPRREDYITQQAACRMAVNSKGLMPWSRASCGGRICLSAPWLKNS